MPAKTSQPKKRGSCSAALLPRRRPLGQTHVGSSTKALHSGVGAFVNRWRSSLSYHNPPPKQPSPETEGPEHLPRWRAQGPKRHPSVGRKARPPVTARSPSEASGVLGLGLYLSGVGGAQGTGRGTAHPVSVSMAGGTLPFGAGRGLVSGSDCQWSPKHTACALFPMGKFGTQAHAHTFSGCGIALEGSHCKGLICADAPFTPLNTPPGSDGFSSSARHAHCSPPSLSANP